MSSIERYYAQGQNDGAAGRSPNRPHGTITGLLNMYSSTQTKTMAAENIAYMDGYKHGAKNRRR